jgi:XTP/dITP diphosphohydrolase
MSHTLLVATANRHKVREIAELLCVEAVHLLSLADLPRIPPPLEDADSFAGNARRKAVHYARESGFLALADDSGLCVEALDGAPGIHSARYGGAVHGDDEANNQRLLRELAGVAPGSRGAHYVCALCLARPDGSIALEVEGTCRGEIAEELRGSGGFGYDPLFRPEGHRLTFGQLPPEIKAGISHRSDAVRRLRALLPSVLEEPDA